MAYVLSLPASSPLERPFAEPLYTRSCSSFASQLSSGTIRRVSGRRPSSPVSFRSCSSHQLEGWPLPNGPVPAFEVAESAERLEQDLGSSSRGGCHVNDERPHHRSIKLEASKRTSRPANSVQSVPSTLETIPFPLFEPNHNTPRDCAVETEVTCGDNESVVTAESSSTSPFKRWLSTLRRRHQHELPKLSEEMFWPLPAPLSSPTKAKAGQGHRKSWSLTSSVGLVTAVKSASMTLAGTSIAPGSRRGTRFGNIRSDSLSGIGSQPRASTESATASLEPVLDEKAWARSIQRCNIIEELVNSEESYICDMKAMVHVYFTLLASTPTVSPRRRDAIQKALNQILQLHEELLMELHKAVPSASGARNPYSPRRHPATQHMRWRSVDHSNHSPKIALLRRRFRRSVDLSFNSSPGSWPLCVSTIAVRAVAHIFDKLMHRFLAYEAYVAHNETLNQEASSTSRLIPGWSHYERGVEALAAPTSAIDQRDVQSKKGLTLADLGIKPVQRICKYPLFFADLIKHTPACDDPLANAELGKVLLRLQETAEEINDARDNPKTRQLIETTWLMQDRLILDNLTEASKVAHIRQLGHVVLCGALHVAYEGTDRVKGQYMICVLYRSCLVLANIGCGAYRYQVVAVIPTFNTSIEAPDNGRGLQCHTAPFTFKLCFQYRYRFHELLLSACSEQEENEWRVHFRYRIAAAAKDLAEGRDATLQALSHIPADMKALGPAFEANVGVPRRVSIRRAATLGPKTNLRQVIIKNTYAQTSATTEASSALSVARSQSHMTTSTMPTLAPRRADRIRLEGFLADVWSKETLPYPGMSTRRTEHTLRASAHSVMRKLSMASITSNFSKRSASFSNFNPSRPEDIRSVSQRAFYHATSRSRRLEKRRTRTAPTVVDFHTAPTAFLPEDFELKVPPTASMPSSSALHQRLARAMTMDREAPTPANTFVNRRRPSPDNRRETAAQLFSFTNSEPRSESGDSGYSSVERPGTVLTQRRKETDSTSTLHIPHKGPVKAKSLLFKLLGVGKE